MRELDRLTEFTITEQHLKLSRRMFVSWDYCEFGAPAIDCKRPYGNSSVIRDMIEILGLGVTTDEDGEYPEELEQQMTELHQEMQIAIQIWLCTGVIQTGTFVRDSEYSAITWRLKF